MKLEDFDCSTCPCKCDDYKYSPDEDIDMGWGPVEAPVVGTDAFVYEHIAYMVERSD